MRRNFERWDWTTRDVKDWRCVECGAAPSEAVHVGRSGVEVPHPYNARQLTCGPDCALARKTRLQRERREEQRRDAATVETPKKRAKARAVEAQR